jgi:hypothetical protein
VAQLALRNQAICQSAKNNVRLHDGVDKSVLFAVSLQYPAALLATNRDGNAAREFISDLASRLANRVQLTTDGHKPYLEAVADAFGADMDYAMLVRLYGEDLQGGTRYSPAVCVGTQTDTIVGNPDRKHVSTSYVEGQNLTMRMQMRRFTRLTNAFSKKLKNHIAAISLHFMHCNFCRIHQTLRVTPAMAAGVTNKLWSIADILALLDDAAAAWARQRAEQADRNGPTR